MYLFLFCHNLQKSSMILPYMSKIQSDTCRGVSLVSTLLLIRFSPRQLFSQLSLQDVGAERLCQLLRAAGQDEIPSKRAMRCSKLVLSIDSRCWKCGTPFKVLFCNSWCNSFQDFSATQPSIKIRLPRNPCQRHPLNWGGASEIGGTRVGSVSCAGLRRDQEELKKTAMEFSLKFLLFFSPVLKTQPKHVPHSFGFQTRSMFYPFLGPSRIINFWIFWYLRSKMHFLVFACCVLDA